MAASSFPTFLVLAIVALSIVLVSVSAREVPKDKNLKPQTFGRFDGTLWIPGIGRFVHPKWGVHPFHANPITGGPGGVQVPIIGGATPPRKYVPGLDDTIFPNPGLEIPIFPGAGSGTGITQVPPAP